MNSAAVQEHTAILLPSGKGARRRRRWQQWGSLLSSAELYDPSSGTWDLITGALKKNPRAWVIQHQAILLAQWQGAD